MKQDWAWVDNCLYLGDELRVLLLLYMFEMCHNKKFKRYLLFDLSVWGKKGERQGKDLVFWNQFPTINIITTNI